MRDVPTEMSTKTPRELSPDEEIAIIEKELKERTFEAKVVAWLNTGNKRLNGVLGSTEFGLPYGKIIELYGPESHGKTMLGLLIAALAQRDGARVGWADFEN